MGQEEEVHRVEQAAQEYYDSADAQYFYSEIFGKNADIHLGRYDLAGPEEQYSCISEFIQEAQRTHKDDLVKLMRSRVGNEPVVVADMGCGYNSLLRYLGNKGMLKAGSVGLDLADKMVQKGQKLDAAYLKEKGLPADLIKCMRQSFLQTNLVPDSIDLCVSTDAFLHVGPDLQKNAIKEAYRILKPGGWLVFTDLMEQENYDPEGMKHVYKRINLSKMGSVKSYQEAGRTAGFVNIGYEDHSDQIAGHYSNIRKYLLKRSAPDAEEKIELSTDFVEKMSEGLSIWVKYASNNLNWGCHYMQKPV